MRLSLPHRFAALIILPILWMTVPTVRTLAQAENRSVTEKNLIENERQINQAIANGDKAAFLALVANDGVWLLGNFVPATLLVNAFGEIKLANSAVANPSVLWVDSTTAIVLYVWTGSGTVLNEPFVQKVASTVWTKRGEKWVAVYHHDSNAPKQ